MHRLLFASILAGLLGGCVAWESDAARMRAEGETRMAAFHDEAVINGILAERTLYPHHFYLDTEELTTLGLRDLGILAAHFRNHPGPLNIRQGPACDDLYAARIAQVQEHLGQWGVAVEAITVTDTQPGGDGIRSRRVFEVMQPQDKSSAPSTGTGAAQ